MQAELDLELDDIQPGNAGGVPRSAGRWQGFVPFCRRAAARVASRHAQLVKFAIHLLLTPCAFYLAFALRFDFDVPPHYVVLFVRSLPVVMAAEAGAFWLLRVDRGWWRYVGLPDLVTLVKATTLSSLGAVVALFLLGQLKGFPRSVLFLDWGLALLLVGGARLAVRIVLLENTLRLFGPRPRARAPALVIGAGNAGERLVRELQRDRSAQLAPVALIDDDPAKVGRSLHGVRVCGTTADLGGVARRYEARVAIIAVPSATREQMQRLVRACGDTGLQCRIVPSLPELLNRSAKLSHVREVQVEDLLGRDAVDLDLSLAREAIAGKVVLVTGGAGSIGSELARQLAALGPKQLVLVEQAESPLYFTDLELRAAFPYVDVVPVVADVCDRTRINGVFAAHRPHYVFHAAAYKHVPLMEHNVVEAVRNNVFGTMVVAETAVAWGTEKFVLISTDKAVRPSSVMGATKRVAERLVLGLPGLVSSPTDFRAVRFGNVLGSNGSVIPLFKAQLAKGGPLTVTHPEVTRYFMTIPEAAQLVLMAATLPGAAGRISMLDMGEPVKIKDLAESLIRLSGLEPGVDVDVRYTGLRPGEKLYEELMSAVEETVPTNVRKIRLVQTTEPDGQPLKTCISQLLAAVAAGEPAAVLSGIVGMVPECVSPLRERGRRDAMREGNIPGGPRLSNHSYDEDRPGVPWDRDLVRQIGRRH